MLLGEHPVGLRGDRTRDHASIQVPSARSRVAPVTAFLPRALLDRLAASNTIAVFVVQSAIRVWSASVRWIEKSLEASLGRQAACMITGTT